MNCPFKPITNTAGDKLRRDGSGVSSTKPSAKSSVLGEPVSQPLSRKDNLRTASEQELKGNISFSKFAASKSEQEDNFSFRDSFCESGTTAAKPLAKKRIEQKPAKPLKRASRKDHEQDKENLNLSSFGRVVPSRDEYCPTFGTYTLMKNN